MTLKHDSWFDTLTVLTAGKSELVAKAEGLGINLRADLYGAVGVSLSETTTRVTVESAHFDPVSIARTRRRHRLPSEASKRNERGVDWEVADEAAERAVQLLVELAGGTPGPFR